MSKIKVVMLEPEKEAYAAEIDGSLHSMQKIVGGLIEAFYPFEEQVCIVCNEEGKINGLPLNRAVYGEDGQMVDIIAGTAFVCDCSGEQFDSLNDEQLTHYAKLFQYPQCFFRIANEIVAIPIFG